MPTEQLRLLDKLTLVTKKLSEADEGINKLYMKGLVDGFDKES